MAGEIEANYGLAGVRPPDRVRWEAPALISLGELDRAAEIVGELSATERPWNDPCGMESLEPLRESPDHASLFAHCPPRVTRGG
jgi:hypothetical protein